MNLIINYPNDKKMLEDKIAYIRAKLIQKYIDEISIKEKDKIKVKKRLEEELKK